MPMAPSMYGPVGGPRGSFPGDPSFFHGGSAFVALLILSFLYDISVAITCAHPIFTCCTLNIAVPA